MREQKTTANSNGTNNKKPEKPADNAYPHKEIITQDKKILTLLDMLKSVAKSKSSVLIQGESGTGKELFARFVYHHSNRRPMPFVAVNCAAIPAQLLESEMFGYEKGAFTGAASKKTGKFELADGGTLLLDEISEMDIQLQAKLLRVIQESEVDRLGGKMPVPVDVRIIATTNADLQSRILQKAFRSDLYYRLNVIPVIVPPLRERNGDVVILAQHFIKKYSEVNEKKEPLLTTEAKAALMSYAWPGNVRELENIIERAILICLGDQILTQHLSLDNVNILKSDEKSSNTILTNNYNAKQDDENNLEKIIVSIGQKKILKGQLTENNFQYQFLKIDEKGSNTYQEEKTAKIIKSNNKKSRTCRELGLVNIFEYFFKINNIEYKKNALNNKIIEFITQYKEQNEQITADKDAIKELIDHYNIKHLSSLTATYSTIKSNCNKDNPEKIKNNTADKLNWDEFIKICKEKSENHLSNIIGRKKYDPDLYINRDNIEGAFNDFCKSDKSGFVIIGSSGMGKTNILCHLFNELINNEYPALFINSSNIDSDMNVENHITDKLNLSISFDKTMKLISTECKERNKQFIVVIDAINEFLSENKGPSDLIKRIDSLVSQNKYPKEIKFLITSRVKIWQVIISSYNFSITKKDYFNNGEGFLISQFAETELEQAYKKYKSHFKLQSEYSDLPELLKKEISDPLMLRFVAEVFQNKRIDANDTSSIFEKYYTMLFPAENLKLKIIVYELASAMYELKKDNISIFSELKNNNSELYSKVMSNIKESGYLDSVNKGIISESSEDSGDHIIKFTYDRFFEYILARHFISLIGEKIEKKQDQKTEIVDFIDKNISATREFNTLWGALQNLLIFIQEGKLKKVSVKDSNKSFTDKEFIEVITALVKKDNPSILALLIDIFEILAIKNIDTIRNIFNELKKMKSESVAHALLDAAYKILTSEHYRFYYLEQTTEIQKEHEEVLYSVFIWGMQYNSTSIADKSIQYIYFLWGYNVNSGQWRYYKGHAENIIGRLVNRIKISNEIIKQVANQVKRSEPNTSSLENLVGLILLILAECVENKDKINKILDYAKEIIIKLKPDILQLVLSSIARYILGIMPNPISSKELKDIFSSKDKIDKFKRVLEFLDTESKSLNNATLDELLKLSKENNSFIYQFLSHALSTKHQIFNNQKGDDYLILLRDMFYKGCPVAQYTSSIAIYHINYFGTHATEGSMTLMEKMTKQILETQKGRFSASDGGKYNYNCIGTFGRAMVKNNALMGEKALYNNITNALNMAKEKTNDEFYEYICENVGLLGTLVPPRKALEIIKYILEDIGELEKPDDSRQSFGFKEDIKNKVKVEIMNSLAKIRVRYQQEVDDFLFYSTDNRELYEAVRKISPQYSLGIYYSWVVEELFEKIFIYYLFMCNKNPKKNSILG